MIEFWKFWLQNRKADLELDELGKIIIGLVLLLVLIAIVTVVIRGEFDNQGDKLADGLDNFRN